MNKIIAIIAIATTAALTGCDEFENGKDIDKAWTAHGMACNTKVVEIEGHQYVLMRGYRSGNIIHAASCSCMNK